MDTVCCFLQVVQWFWEVVHGFNETQRKRLLAFISGTDRVPINGLAALSPRLTVTFNGSFASNLPTVHTCFHQLLLQEHPVRNCFRLLHCDCINCNANCTVKSGRGDLS